MKTPKGYLIVTLLSLLLIASVCSFDMRGIVNGIVAVGVSAAANIFLSRLTRRKRTMPDGAAITGLIVALILSPTVAWPIVAATCLVAIVSKYFVAYKQKPIFNPAAFGLLLSIVLFRTGQSWWGALGDFPAWTVLLLLVGGYAVTHRVNKFPQVFSFLGTYFALLLAMGIGHAGDAADALRQPFINASLFFALFMLTDPPTSPAKTKDQIIFGIVSGAAGAVVYGLFGGLMYLFIGLLAGNLYYFFRKISSARPQLRESRQRQA